MMKHASKPATPPVLGPPPVSRKARNRKAHSANGNSERRLAEARYEVCIVDRARCQNEDLCVRAIFRVKAYLTEQGQARQDIEDALEALIPASQYTNGQLSHANASRVEIPWIQIRVASSWEAAGHGGASPTLMTRSGGT